MTAGASRSLPQLDLTELPPGLHPRDGLNARAPPAKTTTSAETKPWVMLRMFL